MRFDTLKNKLLDTVYNTFRINGTAISDITGTGKVVLDTNPTIAGATLTGVTLTGVTNIGLSVASLAALKALTTRPSFVFMQGRTSQGDGGEGIFQWFSGSSTTANDATVIQCTSGASGRYKRLIGDHINVKWFGAVGDGTTANDTAFNAWLAVVIPSKIPGYIPQGNYKLTAQTAWDCAASVNGVHIYGDGQYSSRLTLTTTSSPAFKLHCSGGVSSSNQINLYYSNFHDFGIYTDMAGTGVEIGDRNLSSAVGSSTFQNMLFLNANSTANAGSVSLRVNQTFSVKWQNCVVGNYATYAPSVVTAGTALMLVGATFNEFSMCSIGNAGTAIAITQAENESYQGFVYGNTFTTLDLENYTYGIRQTTNRASDNHITGGQYFSYLDDGFEFSSTTAFSGPGSAFIVDTPKISHITPHYPLSDTEYRGIIMRGYRQPQFAGTVPASGTPVTNVYGQTISVTLFSNGGPISSVDINGYTIPSTGGNFTLQPEDVIEVTWSGSPAPGWLWSPHG